MEFPDLDALDWEGIAKKNANYLNTDKAISFTVASYSPQTRAESIITVDGIRSFSSRGYLHGEGVDRPQDFFGKDGETITYHDSGEWAPPHDYFWPKSANSYVNFISWVGGDPEITYAKESDTDPYKATFDWSGAVATTDNLMWADMAWRYNANDKTPVYGKDDVSEGVPTLFHHALAQISFQGKLTKKETEDKKVKWTVNVTGFSLSNVAKSGTFSITNSDPASNTTQEWSGTTWTDITVVNTDNLIASTATASDPIAIDTDVSSILAWSSVIPQSAGTVHMTITYTVKTEYVGSKTVEEEVTATADLADFKIGTGDSAVSIAAWERNKRYTYTLIIEPDTGVINIIPVETDWTEGETKEITVE